MEHLPMMMFGLQAIVWGGAFILLVYLLIRRLNIRDKEDFEKRDN